MKKVEMRMWRSHPVLFAAILGAIVGVANVLFIELGGVLGKNSAAVLPMILPNSSSGAGANEATLVQSAILLFIEVLANVLVYALLFSAPVGLIVVIRRGLTSRKNRIK